MERNGSEASHVPASITQEQLNDALGPLFDLLGTDRCRVYDAPGVHIGDGFIELTLAGHVVTAGSARSVTVGDGEYREGGTEVRVRISPSNSFTGRLDTIDRLVASQARAVKDLRKTQKRIEQAFERAIERAIERGSRDGRRHNRDGR